MASDSKLFSGGEQTCTSAHTHTRIYSQVHENLEIDKVMVNSVVYHNILKMKLNYKYETKGHIFSFNFRLFI